MKRLAFIAVLMAFTAVFAIPAFADGDAPVVVADVDTFAADHAQDAISPDDSSAFAAVYRVLDNSAMEDEETDSGKNARHWRVLFMLTLENKSGRTLRNLTITAHHPADMQSALFNREWYNEPVTIFAPGSGKTPIGIEYTWDTYLELPGVRSMCGLDIGHLYDVYFEVDWYENIFDHHREIWHIEPDAYARAVELAGDSGSAPLPWPLLDEAVIGLINDAAKVPDAGC